MNTVQEIYEYVKPFGGDMASAQAIQKKFKTMMKAIEEPYALIKYGLDFSLLDKRFSSRGQYKEPRVEALVMVAFSHLAGAGSTYCTLEEMVNECERIEKRIGWKECTPPLILARSILNHFKIDGEYISTKNVIRSEKWIASDLKYLHRNGKKLAVGENLIQILEKAWGIEYDETQRQAFNLFNTGLGILTGGPGTGKTTVLRGLMAIWQKLGKTPIICCAPTGKAAQRMREATGMPASTIHKALGIRPYIGYEGRLQAEGSFPANALVVVDEVSMLDVELAAVLFRAVRNAKGNLILVGDEDQLQSVGPGAVLRDIIASEMFNVCRLSHIHRQDAGALLNNIARVRDQNYGMLRDETYADKMCFSDEEVLQYVYHIHKRHWQKEHPFDIQVYTPLRDENYMTSTSTINKILHDLHFPEQPFFSPGEPVVVIRNIYDDDGSVYVLNGDLGIVEDNSDGIGIRVDGEYKKVSANDIELAYATTIHKAQGSSCKCAVIVLPEKPASLVSNRLFYVALTRAEKRAVVLYETTSLRDAITNYNEHKRKTRLLELLGGQNVGKIDDRSA